MERCTILDLRKVQYHTAMPNRTLKGSSFLEGLPGQIIINIFIT